MKFCPLNFEVVWSPSQTAKTIIFKFKESFELMTISQEVMLPSIKDANFDYAIQLHRLIGISLLIKSLILKLQQTYRLLILKIKRFKMIS